MQRWAWRFGRQCMRASMFASVRVLARATECLRACLCARACVHVRACVCARAWADGSAQRHCRLIGVEAEGADAMARSLVAGERVYLKDIARFADSTSSAATSAPGLGPPLATSAPGLVGRRCVVSADAAKLARSDARARKHNHPKRLRLQQRKQQRLRGLRPRPKMRGCPPPPARWHGMPHEHCGQPALPLRWGWGRAA